MWRALVNAVMKLRVPQNAGNLLSSWDPVSFSGRTLLHGVSWRGQENLTLFSFFKGSIVPVLMKMCLVTETNVSA